jgi:tetratricopeptide (TPR) repeat protein
MADGTAGTGVVNCHYGWWWYPIRRRERSIEISHMDEIEELRSELSRDPQRVAAAAHRLTLAAEAARDDAQLSRALAVLGRARRYLGDIDLARSDLVRALAAARSCGDDELAADAHLGLAAVLWFAGRPAEASGHLDTAHRLGSDRVRAYVALQRASIAQRVGNLPEALAAYEATLPTLRALGSWTDVAKVLVNRGVIRIRAGECDAAIADLSEAARLFAREGQRFGVAETDHGLGWAYARQGDLPRALRYLDRAVARFRQLDHAALEVNVDRVEVLLSAGLSGDAYRLAVRTAERLSAIGNHAQAAETWLLCARAAMLDGDRAAGIEYAERARAQFAEQGSAAWERAARLEVLLARGGGGDVDELCRLAAELDRAGNARGAAAAVALAVLAACDAGDPPRAATLAAECARRAGRLGILEVRMLAWYARARSAIAGGSRSAATRLIRAGLVDLRRYRASLAAADARAGVAVHAARLTSLGLRLARQRGSAAGVLEWMEQVRAGRRWHPPPRPPGDQTLAAALTELRAVAHQVRQQESAGRDSAELLRVQRRLERAIHRRRLHVDGGGTGPGSASPTVPELREALGGRDLVALAEIDGRLVGVGLSGRRNRLVEPGAAAEFTGAAAAVTSTVRAGLRSAGNGAGGGRYRDRLRRALGVLDRAVAGLATGDGPVVLVVPAALHAVPWQAVPCLAGRPVAIAPSAAWWLETETERRATPTGPPAVVAGPRLVEADHEAALVAGCYPGATTLTGPAATADAVMAALARAPVAHIACHGHIRPDNPLWSSLELFDGPLCVYDLELLPHPPPLMVLSGCDTGVGVRAGEELLGLAATLLGHGTRCLVASVCPIPDSPATSELMASLHRRLSAGSSPAAALAELTTGALDGEDALLAASLACFGTA